MSDSDVAIIRAIVREIPAIDWTRQDDLTRYARAIIDGLPEGTRIMTPPPDTKLVLFNEELMRVLAGQGRVEWEGPEPEGWYEPTIYEDPRLTNSRTEVSTLESELRLAKEERDDMATVLIRLRDFVGSLDQSILDAFVFSETGRQGG